MSILSLTLGSRTWKNSKSSHPHHWTEESLRKKDANKPVLNKFSLERCPAFSCDATERRTPGEFWRQFEENIRQHLENDLQWISRVSRIWAASPDTAYMKGMAEKYLSWCEKRNRRPNAKRVFSTYFSIFPTYSVIFIHILAYFMSYAPLR